MQFWNRGGHPSEAELSALLDHELPERRWQSVTAHLSECEACAARLSGLESTKALIAGLTQSQPSRSFVLGREYERAPPARLGALAFVPAAALSLFLAALALDVAGSIDFSVSDGSSGAGAPFLASKSAEDRAENSAAGAAEPAMAPAPMQAQPGAADQFADIGRPGAATPAAESARTLTAPTPPPPGQSVDSAARADEREGAPEEPGALSRESTGSESRDWLRLLQLGALTVFVISLAPIFWARRSRGVHTR
jgi:hypothetical protein